MSSSNNYVKVHPDDNVLVALRNLAEGTAIHYNGSVFYLPGDVKAKHKFTIHDLDIENDIYMYGIIVGKAAISLKKGEVITTTNVKHKTQSISSRIPQTSWHKPDVSFWENKTFKGYKRTDGSIGTANYWLVFPLVFCENKNIEIIKDAITETLGYNKYHKFRKYAKNQLDLILDQKNNITDGYEDTLDFVNPFENCDGIKFITHQMGCGGTREDARALCGLLAGYLTNPNVAGATVLSLGCQNAQFEILKSEIENRDGKFDKPLYYFDQQTLGSEEKLIQVAIKSSLEGMAKANLASRVEFPLNKLTIGLECGGSDGFSGISANPVLGYVSDMIVALGGSVILAEFPELCGVEQELSNRCVTDQLSEKFLDLMRRYEKAAEDAGSGFDMNPSPGNIKDGLVTDAMKSAGAAKKGGTSLITDVLDYPHKVTKAGLNLLCTPGNDVESTTALAAAGANVILFTTGLGTPTGNPVVPVIKVSSNTALAVKMNDIIDIDTGAIIEGLSSIKDSAHHLLQYIIDVASGVKKAKAVINEQNDFIPWKRGVSL